jgi:hypothetical protein
MSEDFEPKRMTAIHTDPDTGEQTVLGVLEYGAGGKLAVIEANAGYEQYLADLVRETNARDVLHVKVGGAEKFELESKTYRRTDANFLVGLRKFVKHRYLADLTSDEDQVLNPEEFEDLKL